MKANLKRSDLVHPELSYKIIGCCFDVFRQLGPGLLEKDYQSALRVAFTKAGLTVNEQVKYDIIFDNTKVGRGFFDFLIDDKVVVELKRGKFSFSEEMSQLLRYLRMSKHELGIIIRFAPEGVEYKRVVNMIQAA